MSDRFDASYFDGRTGVRRAAELRRVGASHYALEGEGVRRGGSIASLAISPPLARVARTIEFPDGARALLAHDAAIDGWFPKRGRGEAFVDRLERHAYAVAIAMAVCLATLGAGSVWGVPWLADRIAERIPHSVEQALGAGVLDHLEHFGVKASTLAADRRAELSQRFDALAQDVYPDARIEFRDAPGIGANAFAIPGGTVVVTDDLVRLLDDDREFDAVVAHELGHQVHRHTLRQTLRSSFVAVVAALFAGDVSSAGAVVVAVPTFLLTSHYSREFEEEADRFAFETMSRHLESPHWFAEAMLALETDAAEDEPRVAYLSSHPATYDRIEAANEAGRAFATAHPDLCPDGVCPGEEEEPPDADDAGASSDVDCGDDCTRAPDDPPSSDDDD